MAPIDLRSDTVTRPTEAMQEAMRRAELGDDGREGDPTVRKLEALAASRLGKQAALYLPSGTMANLCSLLTHTSRGAEVLLERTAHIISYENSGLSLLGGLFYRPIPGTRGAMDTTALEFAFESGLASKQLAPALVCMETTHNTAGGAVLPLDHMAAVARIAKQNGAKVHLDGARIFNAAVASGTPVSDYAAEVDALSFCFSKGLGAPVGSMVVGDAAFIAELRHVRQMLGGGMRQVGVLCAAARVAIDTGIERLADDHANARLFAEGCADALPGSVDPTCIDTNMVFVDVGPGRDVDAVVAAMAADGVRVATARPGTFRAVTHRDVTRAGIERAISAFGRAVAG
jgi:threonine aldolase